MSRTGLALAAMVLSACTTVMQEGDVLSVAPFTQRCEDHSVRGHLEKVGPAELELSASSSRVCQDGEVRTVKVEQYSESWVPAGTVGLLLGAAIEVPILLATFWLIGKSSSNVGNLGDGLWLLILPGIAIGGGAAAAIGTTRFRLPDAPPRQVEKISASDERFGASEGFVVIESDPSLKFPLVGGKARLPIDQVWKQNLGRLLVNGVLVELDDASPLIAVNGCRLATLRWHLGQQGDCLEEHDRFANAKACHAAGYPFADEVLARLQSMGCN